MWILCISYKRLTIISSIISSIISFNPLSSPEADCIEFSSNNDRKSVFSCFLHYKFWAIFVVNIEITTFWIIWTNIHMLTDGTMFTYGTISFYQNIMIFNCYFLLIKKMKACAFRKCSLRSSIFLNVIKTIFIARCY